MNRVYIFGAGEYFGLVERPDEDDLIIAADGGYETCVKEGLSPDLLLGDFDSLAKMPQGVNILRAPVEKDDTDTLLAVRTGLRQGFSEFHIYGGTGGRLDHTIANLQTLIFLAENGARGYLFEAQYTYTAICSGSLELPPQSTGTVSVFCFGEDAIGVYETGLKYSLTGATLKASYPMGVSNSFCGKPAVISVENGTLVIGWERPRKPK